MTEEQAFLSAITANPDDHTAKLVYADWLQDRDDPRAEILRLKVQIATLQDDWLAARGRLTELEKAAPAKSLVLLDGPVWCIAGNVVESRPYGPGGAETRHGTKLFKPSAKVYLAGLRHSWATVSPERSGYVPAHIRVIGRHRKSADWIGCLMPAEHTTNWRVELVYQPGALVRLKEEGWPGFGLQRGVFVCPEDKASPEAIRGLLTLLGVRFA